MRQWKQQKGASLFYLKRLKPHCRPLRSCFRFKSTVSKITSLSKALFLSVRSKNAPRWRQSGIHTISVFSGSEYPEWGMEAGGHHLLILMLLCNRQMLTSSSDCHFTFLKIRHFTLIFGSLFCFSFPLIHCLHPWN